MRAFQSLTLVATIVSIALAGGSVYTVSEINQAIITQFGEPVGEPVTEPGLHFKLPFIQTANMFEKRFLEWDGYPNQVPTRDRRFIWVDTYARWRITDPLLFFQRLRDERGAQSRLDDILDGETRNAVARHDLIEIVRTSNREPTNIGAVAGEGDERLVPIMTGREAITREILEAAAAAVSELGIELLDLQFKRINYIALRLTHFLSVLIPHQRRDVNRTKWNFLLKPQTKHHHASDPKENNVVGRNEYRRRVIPTKIFRVVRPTKGAKWPQPRAKPCIENIRFLPKSPTTRTRIRVRIRF